MAKTKQNNGNRVSERTDSKLEGRYANYFKVGHNAYEFIIDFGQYDAENDQAELYRRIVTNPYYAKELLSILLRSVKQYEQTYGAIKNDF